MWITAQGGWQDREPGGCECMGGDAPPPRTWVSSCRGREKQEGEGGNQAYTPWLHPAGPQTDWPLGFRQQ